jgi:hypothetical protein
VGAEGEKPPATRFGLSVGLLGHIYIRSDRF